MRLLTFVIISLQSESVIIQKVYTHFKKCPGTHKLGPLYVVDSIARKYLEQAKRLHEPVSHAAPDGTFGAGVHRITNLLPALMNDILQNAPPEENKVRYLPTKNLKYERRTSFPWPSSRCINQFLTTRIKRPHSTLLLLLLSPFTALKPTAPACISVEASDLHRDCVCSRIRQISW